MPELPEVETVRRGLTPHMTSRVVRDVRVRVPALRWPIPADLPECIRGEVVHQVWRRGKYLLIEFSSGWMLIHLGMSGSLRWLDPQVPVRKHDHLDLVFDHGLVRLHDPRRFGAVLWHDRSVGPVDSHPLLAKLGLEPLSATAEQIGHHLYAGTRERRSSIKTVLLAGELVVGAGNIYACESLFRAQIHPATRAGRISRARYQRLAVAVRDTLSDALARGGSTLKDFVSSDGASGYFQIDALVYGREGLTCRRCHGTIRRVVQQQRASFYCPGCQH
jgi:formamidopyrimidine-DNA glycosylase